MGPGSRCLSSAAEIAPMTGDFSHAGPGPAPHLVRMEAAGSGSGPSAAVRQGTPS